MGSWTSLVVLALAVVSTLSFPHPDAEYKIPTVGLGARAQYYVLHSDGTYKYGFDSGDGLYEQSMAQAPGEVTGAFGFKDPTGADIKLEYTADSRGFIATGAHLPVAPEGESVSQVSRASPVAAFPYTAPLHTPTGSSASAAPSAPVEVSNIRSVANGDGSYSFSYDASSSSRDESADAHNSVRGQYAFIADDGLNREIKYIAGAETGYIAEGDSLPQGPAVPGAESGIPTGRILPVLSEEEANALAAASSGSSSATSYTAGTSSTSSFSTGSSASGLSAVASTKIVSPGSSDASYSFNYDAGDSARSESSDADLNIEGSYSFLPPEGHRLTVNYIAGSDTGFVATGDHLPVAPDADVGSRVSGAPSASGVAAYSVASATSTASASPSAPAIAAPSAPIEVAQVKSSVDDDGSYSFSYDASSSSRSESANAHNSVTGNYAFVADDGINREIKYIAGAETGYIAEGDSLPRGPSVPGAESGIPTGRILPVLSEEEANALAASSSGSSIAATYTAGSPNNIASSVASSGATAAVKSAATGRSDASYSFRYDAGDSARHESADADLNIKGSYSFLPPEGHRLTVNYVAGSDTGFVATGDHLPVAPDAVSAGTGSGSVPYSSPSVVYTSPVATSVAASAPASPSHFASSKTAATSSSDASYSFNYDAGDSARSESADADLNVEGSYSFLPPEGHRLTVNYIAGSNTGFVATGDHLPVAPDADFGSRVTSASDATAYSATSGATSASSSTSAAASVPIGVAQVKSSAAGDGSYSFGYETSSSSRSESADAQNSVKGQYAFIADDGVNREIKYIAGSDTGYIAEGDSLPIGPSVPGAESGIPTGRILPVLSEEEANALAAATSSTGVSPFVKSAVSSGAAAIPAVAPAVPTAVYSPSRTATKSAGVTSASKYSSAQPSSSSSGHSSQIVGDVLLHQYDAVNRDKYGYVFTALRR